jgi:hypothetical protein
LDSGLLAVVYKGRANVRLIAAAPELYDLVADAVEDACENESDWNKSARAALAKARGEQNGDET